MLKRVLLFLYSRWRIRQSSKIPFVELQERHVRKVKTLANRAELLKYLPENAVVAEIGVLKGEFSRQILDMTRPAQLHLVDTWSGNAGQKNLATVQANFQREIQSGIVILHQGNSLHVQQYLPEHSLDWLYLDTDHSYETTKKELLLCAAILKPGGILAGHDYVTGNWHGGIRYGVVEAVNEFCIRHDWEFIFLTAETHRHLSFAIRKIEND